MPSLWILGGFVKCFLGDFLRLLGFFAFISALEVRVLGFPVLEGGMVNKGSFVGSVEKNCETSGGTKCTMQRGFLESARNVVS